MRRATALLCILSMAMLTCMAALSIKRAEDVSRVPSPNVDVEDSVSENAWLSEPTWLDESKSLAVEWDPQWPTVMDESLVHVMHGRDANPALYVDPKITEPAIEKDEQGRMVRAEGALREVREHQPISRVTGDVVLTGLVDPDVPVLLTDYAHHIGWQIWGSRINDYVRTTGNPVLWVMELDYADPDDKAPEYVTIYVASPVNHAATVDVRLTIRNQGHDAELDKQTLEVVTVEEMARRNAERTKAKAAADAAAPQTDSTEVPDGQA